MEFGINPANLHAFTRDIVEYYGSGDFDVIDELARVAQALRTFSEHSTDPIDPAANTFDDVIIGFMMQEFQKVKDSVDKKAKQPKSKPKGESD